MSKSVVIVESPAKAKTIGKFLGRKFMVKATMGHLRDLPRSQFGVDIAQGFKPKYITIRGKGKTLKELRDAVKDADRVLLATDPDREGEAISWHLSELLDLKETDACRVEFHEITERAIQDAVKRPRPLDLNLVNAQQARRILDRLVGYKLSPLLWKKVRGGLSAGRVQSVAVRLIVDRENEIRAFVPEEYWTISARLSTPGGDSLDARLHSVDGKKAEIPSTAQADALVARAKKAKFQVEQVRKKERIRNPAPPFTTSTLQQEASRRLGFGGRKTMMLAQQLYEGLDIGSEGTVGLISYIRTDSTRVSTEAQAEAREHIVKKHGTDYVPENPPQYKTKQASAQEAHEAVRPTSVMRLPEQVKSHLTRDQYRLYRLVWERFVASQMAPAVFDTVAADISAGGMIFRATGQTVRFPGFLVLYAETQDEDRPDDEKAEDEGVLPELNEGDHLKLHGLDPRQHFTQPPARYTEAMLVRALEEKGIGRPSTYATLIEINLKRRYVVLESKRFHPTELGETVVDLLEQYFPSIMDVSFTAEMEGKLDRIEEGDVDWVNVIDEFYRGFEKEVATAETVPKREVRDEESDEICELCGRRMVYKYGRYGKFLACPGFPECRNAKPIQRNIGVDCPVCGKPIVERRSKKGRVFFGCSAYPACDFTSWDPPIGEACPECSGVLVLRKAGSKPGIIRCSNKECTYSRKAEPQPEAPDGDDEG